MIFTDDKVANSRYEVRRFAVEMDAVVHGFAGYFETVLYKDVTLSTRMPGMFSRFPVLFPILNPIKVKKVVADHLI